MGHVGIHFGTDVGHGSILGIFVHHFGSILRAIFVIFVTLISHSFWIDFGSSDGDLLMICARCLIQSKIFNICFCKCHY